MYDYYVEDEQGLHVAGPFHRRDWAERIITNRGMDGEWSVVPVYMEV